MTHQRLTIHPTPFKPSHLSIPASPFSPRSPLAPNSRPKPQLTPDIVAAAPPPHPAPAQPLRWIWTCHTCRTAYPLGTTRRCLDDGHRFCTGTTLLKHWRHEGAKRRTKRHRACASEFDYVGWKAQGRWKRSAPESVSAKSTRAGQSDSEATIERNNCWTRCDYPSQCRWGRQVGIHTPTPSPSPTRTSFSADTQIATSILATPIDLPSLEDCFVNSPPPGPCTERRPSTAALGRALEASAQRRKSSGSAPPTSPLSTQFAQTADMLDICVAGVEHPACAAVSPYPAVDESCIDPALLALSCPQPACCLVSAASAVGRRTGGGRAGVGGAWNGAVSFSSSRESRRCTGAVLVASAERRMRRRHAVSTLGIQTPLAGSSDSLVGDIVPLESVRWDESVLNV